jgi:hypothetical protein
VGSLLVSRASRPSAAPVLKPKVRVVGLPTKVSSTPTTVNWVWNSGSAKLVKVAVATALGVRGSRKALARNSMGWLLVRLVSSETVTVSLVSTDGSSTVGSVPSIV